jgi:murein DD-endopeptidase MepM/ murein hydrolase activator NlpD
MKNSLLLLALVVSLPLLSPAQRVIEVNYILDTHGNYVFSCTNRAYCDYVLDVSFTTLNNAKSDHPLPFEAEVRPGINKLFTISAVNAKDDIKINYKSSYRKGCLHPVVNPDFTYLLPIAPGKEAQAYIIGEIPASIGAGGAGAGGAGAGAGGAGTGAGTGRNGAAGRSAGSGGLGGGTAARDSGYAIQLKMKAGDTIYAARRGVVTGIDAGNGENDAGISVRGELNTIEIVQGDCSFGEYGVLQKNGALVRPGQVVEAGTPIGLVGGDKYGRGSDVRFSVGYYDGQRKIQIPLQFWTKKNGKGMLKHGGTYISEHPRAIVLQEMPREKKKPKKDKISKKS